MQHIIKTSWLVWSCLIWLVCGSLMMLFVILQLKIEQYFLTTIYVDEAKNNLIYINSSLYYRLQNKTEVVVLVNQKTYQATIEISAQKLLKNHLFTAFITIDQLILIPNTTLKAQIIYEQKTIQDYLLAQF